MTPIELLAVLLEGPFLSQKLRIDSLLIICDYWLSTGNYIPDSRNGLALVS